MRVQIPSWAKQGLLTVDNKAHDLKEQVQFLPLPFPFMHDSVLLVSIILLYLLSGEKMTRPVLAVLLLLMVFFLTSPT